MPTATIDVDTDTYVDAGTAFLAANDAVCDLVSAAATAAGAGGGMAGTDSGGVDWARSYDTAAASALTAGATLADRLGELSTALTASGVNHADAEAASAVSAASADRSAPTTPAPGSVLPATPPPAAGGSTSPPSAWWAVAHLLPFRWPDASPATLRSVAVGWNTAAAGLQECADQLTDSLGALSAQRTPETDAVVARCTEAQLAVRALAESAAALGAACDARAEHVQQAQDAIRAALSDVGDLASASVDVGVAVVTGDDVLAHVRELVQTISDILARLETLLDAGVDALVDVLDRITALISRLADLVTTVVTVGFSLAAVAPAAVAGVGRSTSPGIDLQAMEGPGPGDGHTIREHVGRSDAELKQRAVDDDYAQTSSFRDLATAETLTGTNIAANMAWISRWLRKQKQHGQLVISAPAPAGAGRIYDRTTDSFLVPKEVVTVLERTGAGTFVVLPSYLEP